MEVIIFRLWLSQVDLQHAITSDFLFVYQMWPVYFNHVLLTLFWHIAPVFFSQYFMRLLCDHLCSNQGYNQMSKVQNFFLLLCHV